MSATARLVQTEAPANEKPDEVLIHVRFSPSGDVFTIDQLPQNMKANDWHKSLMMGAPQHYQTLAGGRGFYRIPRATYQSILAQASA
jgi:hypothetical protein